MSSRLIQLLSVLVVLAIAGAQMLNTEPLRQGRDGLFDIYQRLSPRMVAPGEGNNVVVVDIDDESLRRVGQWPWPRDIVARMLDRLTDAEVASVGFDMVFSEPDRTSPRLVLNNVHDLADHERDALIQRFPDFDEELAKSLQRARVVLGAAGVADVRAADVEQRGGIIAMGDVDITQFIPTFKGVLAPLPSLALAATGVAALNRVVAPDGVLREVPMVVKAGDWIMPSLGAATLALALGADSPVVEVTPAGVLSVLIGDRRISTTAQGTIRLHFGMNAVEHTFPAWQVLTGAVPIEQLKGKIVLVGTSAIGLNDLVPTPLGMRQPGVEAHALLIEHVLAGDALLRPAWAAVAEGFVTVVLGALLIAFSLRSGALYGAAIAVSALVVLTAISWVAFSNSGVLFDPLPGGVAILAAFLICSLGGYLSSERQTRWIRRAFASYVSPNLVAHLVENPGALTLGGERRECSFVMTDMTDFTPLMELFPPEKVVAVLNAYLDGMVAIAFAHGGTLDRIVGDAVAVMFSAPVIQADHRTRAVGCALAMDQFARDFAATRRLEDMPFGDTRIGVHAGEVIVGNFGGQRVLDYRALGDAINTASRLEGAGKYLGVLVTISAEVLQGVEIDGLELRPIGHVQVKGKTKAINVFEPITAAGQQTAAPLAAYLQAYDLMAQGLGDAALEAFGALAANYPDDRLVAVHLRRLSVGEQGTLFSLYEK
jgi:adenylate cyclase